MKISAYLFELLVAHECVIIPGFGGFITNENSAEVDFKHDRFIPPTKNVSFNIKLTQDDGLLISQISRLKSIEYGESKQLVQEQVNCWFEELQSGRKVIMDQIGEFYLDEGMLLQFVPEENSNFLLNSFGLTTFHYPSVNQDTMKWASSASRQDIKPIHLSKKLSKRIAIGVPLLIAIAFVSSNWGSVSQLKTEVASLNPFKNFMELNYTAPMIGKITVDNRNYHPGTEEIYSAYSAIHHSLNNIREQEVEVKKYHLIAGSFGSVRNAQRLVGQLNKKGFSAVLIPGDINVYRVSLSSFEVKSEALDELYNLRKKHGQLWLLKQ